MLWHRQPCRKFEGIFFPQILLLWNSDNIRSQGSSYIYIYVKFNSKVTPLKEQNELSNANKGGLYSTPSLNVFSSWDITDAPWFLGVETKKLVKVSSQNGQFWL